MTVDWQAVAALSGAGILVATVLGFAIKHARPPLNTARLFIRNLIGIPANPIAGQPRVPGLFEQLGEIRVHLGSQDETLASLGTRLTTQDRVLAEQDVALKAIKHEVQPNGGSSMKDSAARVEAKVKALEETVAAIVKHLQKDGEDGQP